MSLFIGNVSRSVNASDLEKEFNTYGPCKVNFKGNYAFAEFDHEKDAEDAVTHLGNKMMGGRSLNVEWSRKSGRFDEGTSRKRKRSINEGRCYNCGSRSHYLRDCK